MEKISVIVPIYNLEQYIQRCVQSILNNTYRELEIICVDDCSSDSTRGILHTLAQKDSRVTVLELPYRGGVSRARNVGIEEATGEYIAFVDGDDYVHEKYFECLLKAIKEHQADISCCRVKRVTDSDPTLVYEGKTNRKIGMDEIWNDMHLKWHIWAKLYKRVSIGNVRFNPDVPFGEDYVFHMSLLLNDAKVTYAVTEETLYGWYVRKNSASFTYSGTDIQILASALYDLSTLEENHDIYKFIYVDCVKHAISARYLCMFEKNAENNRYLRSIMKNINKRIWKRNDISWMTKVYCITMSYFPVVYRFYRIQKDPTMRDWEKSQRRINEKGS